MFGPLSSDRVAIEGREVSSTGKVEVSGFDFTGLRVGVSEAKALFIFGELFLHFHQGAEVPHERSPKSFFGVGFLIGRLRNEVDDRKNSPVDGVFENLVDPLHVRHPSFRWDSPEVGSFEDRKPDIFSDPVGEVGHVGPIDACFPHRWFVVVVGDRGTLGVFFDNCFRFGGSGLPGDFFVSRAFGWST